MKWIGWLALGLPAAVTARVLGAPEWCVFAASAIALIPMAHWISEAAEHLAAHTGAALGGLLTATFGNAAELIITFFALRKGLVDLVKASITGSIIGNTLLITGVSALVGGLKHGRQKFPVKPTGRHAAMMILAVAALGLPAVFARVEPSRTARRNESIGIAILLLATYACSIFYAHFWSHRKDKPSLEEDEGERPKTGWPLSRALWVLGGAVAGTAVASELLVHAVEGFSEAAGLSPSFIGLIVIPFVGNVAEHYAAVDFALANRIDLSFSIAANSSTQIALFVAPLLVLVSLLFHPMDLTLKAIELVTLFFSSAIFAYLSVDGETNWFEGVQLLALYLIAAVSFFFLS
ncbi:MAG TPA: calcium/proton exchanger [Thermoanaerobaculia bacterium]